MAMGKKRAFHGGVHPEGHKEMSLNRILIPAPVPEQVVIPMVQHIGAPCTCLVKPGDVVALGQKIGDGEGLCVPVHSSVSGRVLAVEPRRHPNGQQVLCAVIQNDTLDTPAPSLTVPENAGAEALCQVLREAGLVGMGGAAFPTGEKVRSGLGRVDTLIGNACECESYITADHVLLCTSPRQVLEGLRLLAGLLHPQRVVLAVEDNKKAAIASAVQALAEMKPEGIPLEIKVLPTRYPQGSEKQLIEAVTGRQVPAGKLPGDVGCAVFNAATLAAVYQALVEKKPLTHRIVTVTGEGVRIPGNFLVPIGTPISALVKAAGGLTEDAAKVICGGPMMGVAQSDLDAPVIKSTNAVLCLTEQETQQAGKRPVCIRCGRCVAACPVNLQPLYLYRYEGKGDVENLEKFHALDCMECGCCAYTCPGKLPLVERIRAAKRLVKEGRGK